MLRLLALGLMFAAATSAHAKEVCGNATAAQGLAALEVWVKRKDAEPMQVTWTRLEVMSADRTYCLATHYEPDGSGQACRPAPGLTA